MTPEREHDLRNIVGRQDGHPLAFVELLTLEEALVEIDQSREALSDYENHLRDRGEHLLSAHCWCSPETMHVGDAS